MTDTRVQLRAGIVGRAALLAAAIALISGCAAPRNHLYRRSAADFERAIVLPLNLVSKMPGELIDSARYVDRALLDYLAQHGKAVEAIGFSDASAAWRASEAECRSQGKKDCNRFAGVARFMAQHLRRDRDFQILIIPYLFVRSSRMASGLSRWHGVERTVERVGKGYAADTPPRQLRGDIRAASLKVFAFSAEGERVFEGVGGLELVDRLYAPEGYTDYDVELRDDLFQHPEPLREGVALALEHLVPQGS